MIALPSVGLTETQPWWCSRGAVDSATTTALERPLVPAWMCASVASLNPCRSVIRSEFSRVLFRPRDAALVVQPRRGRQRHDDGTGAPVGPGVDVRVGCVAESV